MEQLTILAAMSELKLLRDLANLAGRRKELSRIAEANDELLAVLDREATGTAELIADDPIAAPTFAAYASNSRRRLAALQEQKREATEAQAKSLKIALQAQGRARAVALLQDQARTKRQVASARRDEMTSLSCLAKCQSAPLVDE